MTLWSLVLKKDEPAEFTFINREKPKRDSWFYNIAFDTMPNSIPADSPKIRPIIKAAEELCAKLKLFPEKAPECCTKESVLIKRGYETLVCIARFEAFEAMVEDGVIKIRTNRYFFSSKEMNEIYDFIDAVIHHGWFD